jgi:penicillin-binding protein 1A
VLASFTPKRKEVISDVTAYSVIKMMQGVMSNGTGAGIWGYGVPGDLSIAGKTGTTNDNSDAWFIGYTPQYLAGGWVGCDDRFIRISSKNGEGGRAAMPIWAYFFNKAAADPNCGIDTKLTFTKPDVMSTDINIDYINGTVPMLGGEGEDMGAGSSSDYEIPKDIKPEEIGSESQYIVEESPKPTEPKETKKSTTNPAVVPVNKSNEKPKAVMPPKKTGGKN